MISMTWMIIVSLSVCPASSVTVRVTVLSPACKTLAGIAAVTPEYVLPLTLHS